MAFNSETTGTARHEIKTAGGRSSTPEALRRTIADTDVILDAVQTELAATYYTAAQIDALLPPLAAIRRVVPTVNAEAADNITVDLAIHDGNGDPVTDETIAVLVESFDAAMDPVPDDTVLTLAETGAGSESSTTAKPRLLIATSAAGAAQITAHDVAGASGLTFRLRFTVMPAVGIVGQAVFQAITFDGT